MTNLIGQTLLNQYRVEHFVAAGGMGAVYRVWDTKRNVPLAMKVLHSDLADDPQIFKRFQREAQALQQLRHPHIVPFYGMYQDSGTVFILQAFIEGASLKDILREHKTGLPLGEALVYIKAVCAALGYAHQQGIVHCDIKPANILVSQAGEIYLTDFGISKFTGGTATSTFVAGTPAYMAPEQVRGRGIAPATDVYALGVMAFEMLSGQRPFTGTEPATAAGGNTISERIRYGHLQVTPPNLSEIRPSIESSVSQVLMQSLAKSPQQRYTDAPNFFYALCKAVNQQPKFVPAFATLSTQPGQTFSAADTLSNYQPPGTEIKNHSRRTKQTGVAVVGGLFLCLAIVLLPRLPMPPDTAPGNPPAWEGIESSPIVQETGDLSMNTLESVPTSEQVIAPKSTLTALPPSSPTYTPTATKQSGPPFDEEKPEEFIRWYFEIVCAERNYEYLWQFMTQSFKNKNSQGGFDEYVRMWDANERVEVGDIVYIETIQGMRKYNVALVFHYKRDGYKPQSMKVNYYLSFDNGLGHWQFDRPDIP
jgi:eukaryotic-like serine/threonine-protein kinase